MELWNLKGNALRLMFADSDINFDYNDFESGTLYDNGNTRDKLVRMNDSIRRGIDLYYQFCGQYVKKAVVKYARDEEGFRENFLDLSNLSDFGIPKRIDVLRSNRYHIDGQENLEYFFDDTSKRVYVDFKIFDKQQEHILDKIDFILHYEMDNKNLPDDSAIDELTFNLDSIGIPSEIQRALPLYIKGELYEEDEYAIARSSKNEYIQFLMTHRKKFGNVQNKVNSIMKRG